MTCEQCEDTGYAPCVRGPDEWTELCTCPAGIAAAEAETEARIAAYEANVAALADGIF